MLPLSSLQNLPDLLLEPHDVPSQGGFSPGCVARQHRIQELAVFLNGLLEVDPMEDQEPHSQAEVEVALADVFQEPVVAGPIDEPVDALVEMDEGLRIGVQGTQLAGEELHGLP